MRKNNLYVMGLLYILKAVVHVHTHRTMSKTQEALKTCKFHPYFLSCFDYSKTFCSSDICFPLKRWVKWLYTIPLKGCILLFNQQLLLGSKIVSNFVLLHMMFYFSYHARLNSKIDTPTEKKSTIFKSIKEQGNKKYPGQILHEGRTQKSKCKQTNKNLKSSQR